MKQQVAGLQALVRQVNGDKGRFPALRLVQTNPELAAAVSKLVHGEQTGNFDITRKNAETGLNAAQIQAISDHIRARSKDNENILQLFPDLELAIQIVISSVLSPKDMVKTELIYKAKEAIFRSELLTQLLAIVQEQLDKQYELTGELNDILRSSLYETGSFIKAVLPESIIDAMINQNMSISNEGLVDVFDEKKNVRALGYLGASGPKSDVKRHALESFFDGKIEGIVDEKIYLRDGDKTPVALEHLEITDNFHLLKLPKLIEVGNKQKAMEMASSFRKRSRTYAALESARVDKTKRLSTAELSTMLYKDTGRDYQHMMVLPSAFNLPRRSVGRPLVMRIPSEAAIPVFVPGDEKKHIGYFIVVDADGNPVNKDYQQQDMDGLAGILRNQANNQNMSSLLIDKAKKNMVSNNDTPTLDNIASVYASIVENDLLERLNNGLYGSNVKIGGNEEVYRIMLARSLKAKFTRLVYIPVDFVSYFAFKHFANGVGKSYFDDVKNLCSIRAILLFAKTMAQVKSAINVTKVNMTLDPQDPDPQKTIEVAIHEVAKMRQMYFPLGINSPVDLTDWITRAGLEFTFTNHPGLPETSFAFETDNFKHEIPDNELDDALRKQTYMAMGLSPEMVDNGFNAEFATTAVQNNILLSKRIMQLQDTFKLQLTDHVKRVVTFDETIQKEIRSLLEENKADLHEALTEEEKADLKGDEGKLVDYLLDKFIANIEVDLPRPDVTTLETQSEAFNQYEEALDKAINYWISSEVVTGDIAGEVSGNMDSLKLILKAYYMRNWMAMNNYLPELADMVAQDEDNKPILDLFEINKAHIQGLVNSFLGFAKTMNKVKAAANADLETLGTPEGEASAPETSSGSDSTGGDAGGGDEFSMDLDLPGPEGGEGGEGGTVEESAETTETPPEGGEAEPVAGAGNESIHIDPISTEVKPGNPGEPGVLFCN